MKQHRIGIVMNGVTGRMGKNQHLLRSIAAILKQGGVRLGDDEVIVPAPILVGRSAARLEPLVAAVEAACGVRVPFTTDLDAALGDAPNTIYFDAQLTSLRAAAVGRAIAAGKHIYCEKPTADGTKAAYDLYAAAKRAGVKHGAVQDKLWLPGLRKLKGLIDRGFFGQILSVRGEFGYWVFEGEGVTPQRPSWNYRKEDGGGIILDMFPHWRYVLDNLFGGVRTVTCLGATHVGRRVDEAGRPYTCTAEDAAYATFELAGGVICHFNSSWAVRVRRDDLLTLTVDGTRGSAVAGLRDCFVQPAATTPRPVWNPELPSPIDFQAGWQPVPDREPFDNAFKVQWELFLRHVARDEPFPWDLLEAARGVQLAEAAHESWQQRRTIELDALRP